MNETLGREIPKVCFSRDLYPVNRRAVRFSIMEEAANSPVSSWPGLVFRMPAENRVWIGKRRVAGYLCPVDRLDINGGVMMMRWRLDLALRRRLPCSARRSARREPPVSEKPVAALPKLPATPACGAILHPRPATPRTHRADASGLAHSATRCSFPSADATARPTATIANGCMPRWRRIATVRANKR